MTTPTYSPIDIVNFAAQKDAVGIDNAFKDLIGQRILDAIQARKQEVAAKTFADETEQAEEDAEVTADDEIEIEASAEEPSGDATEQEEQETEESDENTELTA